MALVDLDGGSALESQQHLAENTTGNDGLECRAAPIYYCIFFLVKPA